jgi:hypothetical protein
MSSTADAGTKLAMRASRYQCSFWEATHLVFRLTRCIHRCPLAGAASISVAASGRSDHGRHRNGQGTHRARHPTNGPADRQRELCCTRAIADFFRAVRPRTGSLHRSCTAPCWSVRAGARGTIFLTKLVHFHPKRRLGSCGSCRNGNSNESEVRNPSR